MLVQYSSKKEIESVFPCPEGELMTEKKSKYVEIDGFRIPRDNAAAYRKVRDDMVKEAETFFHTFCEVVKQEKLDDLMGEGIVGYSATGEMLARICLDPFELAALNVAKGRHRLKQYILAKNGYMEEDYDQLLKEFEERKKAGEKTE